MQKPKFGYSQILGPLMPLADISYMLSVLSLLPSNKVLSSG